MQACPFPSGVQFKGIFQIVCSRAHGGPFIIKSVPRVGNLSSKNLIYSTTSKNNNKTGISYNMIGLIGCWTTRLRGYAWRKIRKGGTTFRWVDAEVRSVWLPGR